MTRHSINFVVEFPGSVRSNSDINESDQIYHLQFGTY